MKPFVLIITTLFLLSFASISKAQCSFTSSAGYTVTLNVTPVQIVLASGYPPCPSGYGYNVKFNYSIKITGTNNAYNGNVGIQLFIYCSATNPANQGNGYFTINNPAPILNAASSSITYTGQLTTSTQPYNSNSDCATATTASLGCSAFNITNISGPGTFTANNSGNCGITVLPINLESFSATCNKNNIHLDWVCASEINNDYFNIQKSLDGITWNTIGKIFSKNTSAKNSYSFTDIDVNNGETIFYKLKQTDLDGKVSYSNLISVKKCTASGSQLLVLPNPNKGLMKLFYKGNVSTIHKTEIFNSSGKKIYSSSIFNNDINISKNGTGIYYIKILKNDGEIVTEKVVVIN